MLEVGLELTSNQLHLFLREFNSGRFTDYERKHLFLDRKILDQVSVAAETVPSLGSNIWTSRSLPAGCCFWTSWCSSGSPWCLKLISKALECRVKNVLLNSEGRFRLIFNDPMTWLVVWVIISTRSVANFIQLIFWALPWGFKDISHKQFNTDLHRYIARTAYTKPAYTNNIFVRIVVVTQLV